MEVLKISYSTLNDDVVHIIKFSRIEHTCIGFLNCLFITNSSKLYINFFNFLSNLDLQCISLLKVHK